MYNCFYQARSSRLKSNPSNLILTIYLLQLMLDFLVDQAMDKDIVLDSFDTWISSLSPS